MIPSKPFYTFDIGDEEYALEIYSYTWKVAHIIDVAC